MAKGPDPQTRAGKKPAVSNKNARGLALRVLRSIEQKKGFSNRILDDHIEKHLDMDPRDRALATLLVYGVLRHQQRLDHHIDAVAHKPKKIKGELRCALRIATYELLELDRPLPIASAQACAALKGIDPQGRLRPVIGGVLRNVQASAAKREAQWTTPLEQLVWRYSIPQWLAEQWLTQLGDEGAITRAKACAQVPWIDLRLSAKAPGRQELLTQLQAHYPAATFELPDPNRFPRTIRARSAGDLHFGPLYQAGQVSIQSLGSQQATNLLQVSPGERVLDACCGMGTKTMQLLEALQGQGQLVAVDQNQPRLDKVNEQRQRLSLEPPDGGFFVYNADLLEHDALPPDAREDFDAALLDAPCSGLGNLARHPELRWTANPEDLKDRVALQRKLLSATLARVKPGGRLVYAVCSLSNQEGPEQIAWLLAQPAIAARRVELLQEDRWTPEEHQSDGFYAAALRVHPA